MITIDWSKNDKQIELLNEVLMACKKREDGVSDYLKYFFFGGAIRGGKTFSILGILIILCKKFPKSKWAISTARARKAA